VAAHVQAETIPDAMSPGFTLRDAVLNSSGWLVSYVVYLFCIYEMPIITKAKKNPTPITTPMSWLAPRKHNSIANIPYPAPTGSGVTVVSAMMRKCRHSSKYSRFDQPKLLQEGI